MEQGRITLGMGVSMATPFPIYVWKEVRGIAGRGVVVTIVSSKWRWASCIILGRKVDVTMVASTSLPKQARAPPFLP